MAWSHSEAAKAGVEVDSEKVNRWIDWSHKNLFEPFPLERPKVSRRENHRTKFVRCCSDVDACQQQRIKFKAT